jgi:hypothetical protein
MLNKKEIIEKFLFGGNIEEQKEKFEIAWDIWENLDEIKKEMRRKVLATLVNKIRNSEDFSDYETINWGLLEGQKKGALGIYKKNWLIDFEAPLLSYAIEADRKDYYELYFGIAKWDNDAGIPFKGNWKGHAKIPSEWKDIFSRIYRNLVSLSKDWETSNWWIGRKWIDSRDSYYCGMWQKEFYLEVIEKGYEAVANYYFNELLNLKKLTENLIDEFVEIYKKSQKTD